VKKEKVLKDAKPTAKTASYDGRFKRHDGSLSRKNIMMRPGVAFD
jgi:hypothetical protein